MLLAGLVLGIRFLLEVCTVIGLFSGVFIKKEIYQKLIFVALAVIITFVWAKYGAPKSPTVLTGGAKLILELAVYSIGTFAFFSLFGNKIGIAYFLIASLDLLLMYLLNLQGH
ncbi:MAG: DUF2568 domain-containing protein [Enterococcus malodoratus]|uniref:DUF2568 domain-containing protein n=1 Tax=Enterococcus malodoratus TaxID=71451 RepID=UPI000919E5C2|nr:DUF2568 domain-containing protein [Enterococcus malodoratus]OJG65913.1 hypothetical protein RV07_GL001500 [Enterococcus malodoratus]